MVYFDNAATTFPKPPSVINEINNCLNLYCGNPGRSGHSLSIRAAEKIYECRESLAEMFGFSNPTNVVFTPNTTYALNIAINAFAKKKCHVIISDIEHNSVYRPVSSLTKMGIDYDIFTIDSSDSAKTIKSLKSKIRHNTCLVVCSHVSNVCGLENPIFEIGKICTAYGIKFVVDGAQSAGTHNININECNIDAFCAPGHKGLYGPQGTGFVIFSDKYSSEKEIARLTPFVFGGNGFNSADKNMPLLLPERFEGGTLNTPGIAALCEGIRFVKALGIDACFEHTSKLYSRAVDMLSSIPNTFVYCSEIPKSTSLLFNVDKIPSDNIARLLDEDGICVRSGLHCSPLVHKKLKTPNGGIRLSFSVFNTLSELDTFYKSIKRICSEI